MNAREYLVDIVVPAYDEGRTLGPNVELLALVALSVPYAVAGGVGFAVGAVNGYRLNRRWTFKSADSTESQLRYLAVQLAGLGTTTLLLWLFVGGSHLHRLASYALAMCERGSQVAV